MSESYRRFAGAVTGGASGGRCHACGYDRRGLRPGSRCPECGEAPESRAAAVAASPDPFLAVGPEGRGRLVLGARLALLVLVASILVRVGAFLWGLSPTFGRALESVLHAQGLLALIWCVAMGLLLSRDLVAAYGPGWRRARWVAILGPLLLAAAFPLLAHRATTIPGPGTDWLLAAAHGLRVLGGVAVLVGFALLHHLCTDTVMEAAARRFSAAVWLLPIIAILGLPFRGSISWIEWILLGHVIFAWAWVHVLAMLAFRELASHVHWARRHAEEAVGRDERIKAKRAALEAEVRRGIRPLPTRGDA